MVEVSQQGIWLLNVLNKLKCEILVSDGHYGRQSGDKRIYDLYPQLSGEEDKTQLEQIRILKSEGWSGHGDVSWNIARNKEKVEMSTQKKTYEMTGSPRSAGFQNKKELVEILEKKGYVKGNEFELLLTDSHNSTTVKMIKAKKNGITIMTYDELIKQLNIKVPVNQRRQIRRRGYLNEQETIESIKQKIKEQNNGNGITIRCGKHKLENVTECININGTKKADFALKNSENEFLYISHKKGNWGYNGYGSVGKKAYEEGNRCPTKHPLIFKIMKWARKECIKHNPKQTDPDGIVEWTGEDGTRGRIMTPPVDLQNYLVYGVDYTKDNKNGYGENNCHIIGIGNPCFKELNKNTFELTFTDETISNGTAPSGKTELVLVIGGPVGKYQEKGGKQEKVILTESNESNKGLRGWVGIFPIQGLKKKIDPITPDNLRNSKLKNLKWVDWPL